MEVVREHLSKENEVGLICYTNKEIDVEANLSFTSSPDLKMMIVMQTITRSKLSSALVF